MRYDYTPERLTIYSECVDMNQLAEWEREDPDYFQSDTALFEALEPLLANSELDWVAPEITGDLTSAPILGVMGEPVPSNDGPPNHPPAYGWTQTAHGLPWDEWTPILMRWGYADYQIRSPLQDLLEYGKVTFASQF